MSPNLQQTLNRLTRPFRADEVNPQAALSRRSRSGMAVAVAIVLDVTESMTPYIQGLLQALDGFLGIIEDADFETTVGLILYRDELIGEKPDVYGLGTPASELRRVLSRVRAEGGGDLPESALPALMRAIHLFDACPLADARHVILHITDDKAHMNEGPTPESVSADLTQRSVTYFACAPREQAYVQFANVTGGVLKPISRDISADDFRDMVLAMARTTVATLTMSGPEAGAELQRLVNEEQGEKG